MRPRHRHLRHTAMLILAFAGLLDSAYLTWYHYDPSARVCVVTSGCETVNASPYAVVGPVPVAAAGIGGYLALMSLLLVRHATSRALRPATYAIYGLSIVGSGFALYLTGIEVFVLHAICSWCVVSATLIVAMCVLATLDVTDAT